MADAQREFAFRSLGLVLVEVCLALFERDHGLPPEVLKPIRRQLGVAHRVLDIAMAKIRLQCPRIMPLVCQGEATGVSKHVGVSLEVSWPPLSCVVPNRSYRRKD